MCEYCGCQALTAIDELTKEHDFVVDLLLLLLLLLLLGGSSADIHLARTS